MILPRKIKLKKKSTRLPEINEDSAKEEEEQLLTPEQHFLAEKLAITLSDTWVGTKMIHF